jgi:hypothetical protein
VLAIGQASDRLFEFVMSLMANDGDIAVITMSTVPTALNANLLMRFVEAVSSSIGAQQSPLGFFENPASSGRFILTALKIVKTLVDQPDRTSQTVDAEGFWRLFARLVADCDLIPGEEYRLLCAQCMVSVQKLMTSYEKPSAPKVRHKMAKALLGWISSVTSPSKQFTTVMQAAIGLLLDNLALLDCTEASDPSPRKYKQRTSSCCISPRSS